MSPVAKDVRAPREDTLQWFAAGETFTNMRHRTEYLPDRWFFLRLFATAPFLIGLVITLCAGAAYWYLH